MNMTFGIDFHKSMEEMFTMQKKFIKGMDTLLSIEDVEVDLTPKDLVFSQDKMKLYHYRSTVENPCKVPTLITYALVNRQYMMDIQPERSVVKKLLDLGLDLYIIDWGYPTQDDLFLSLDDYINGYMNDCVDFILQRSNNESLNVIGICQGGTFSTIYASLYPEKVRNLVTMVTPIDFDVKDGLLFQWGKHLNIDNMVDTYGVVPGHLMNYGYMMLKPFQLMLDKYVGIIDNMDNKEVMESFMRMEKWIFDSPGQAGEALRQFVKDLYQENKLIKGTLEIGGRRADLKNINMPILNIYAEHDHLVPPTSSKPLNDLVSSEDRTLLSFPVGHIGMYVSSRSQKEVAPQLAQWILERSR